MRIGNKVELHSRDKTPESFFTPNSAVQLLEDKIAIFYTNDDCNEHEYMEIDIKDVVSLIRSLVSIMEYRLDKN